MSTSMKHMQHFISDHAHELHRVAVDGWREYGPGYIAVTCDRREHAVLYVTQVQHQQNLIDGTTDQEVAEAAGKLLAMTTDPERAFPVMMEHRNGTITGLMVNAIPCSGGPGCTHS